MEIIDAHCHIGRGINYSLSVDELLKQMDGHGVASAVAVPVDRCIAVDNKEGNDFVLAAARSHPDRIIPFATANPWYGDRAVDEIKRCFEAGAAGLKLHPVLQGFSIIDRVCFPLIEEAVSCAKPVYFHTGTPVHCTPFQLTELAMTYPEGQFIMGHTAYADYWNDVSAAVKATANIYIETSLHLASFVKSLNDELGADKIIYGSDLPKTSMRVEIDKISRYIESEADREAIFAGNIRRLLGRGC